MLKITVLGSGTSHGVPMIGCRCDVCTSNNPKNRRYRSSICVESDEAKIIVDTPPELRLQLLENNITHADAVLLTHSHADHLFGFDDIRRLNDLNGKAMPVYGDENTLLDVRRVFDYVFKETPPAGGKPVIELHQITGDFSINGLCVKPLPLFHVKQRVLGYRFKDFAYCTDVSEIPSDTEQDLFGLKVLMLDATRYAPHPAHFHMDKALEVIDNLQPERAILTHLSHCYDHYTVNGELPEGVELAYDRMVIEI